MSLHRAQRKAAPLKIGFSGPSGSGKTYSALLMASGLASWDKIAVIDTENRSADLYSHLGGDNTYFTIPLSAPFEPEKYIAAIHECEKAGMKVIIIDSITHEWDGSGGCLEIQDRLGGRYQDWRAVTPRHQKFIDAILQSPCHVFTTVRRKQDYEMSKNETGKVTVTKVGMREVTRDGFEYELTLSFEIEISHLAKQSKDRTGLFVSRPAFVITPEHGKELLTWSQSGAAESAPSSTVDTVPSVVSQATAAPDKSDAGVKQSSAALLTRNVDAPASAKPLTTAEVKEKLNGIARQSDGLVRIKTAIKKVAGVDEFKSVPADKYPALLAELGEC